MTNDWQALLTPEITDFIAAHENGDVRALALKKPPNTDWPYPLILDQIKARQKAKLKIPSWLAIDNIIFPTTNTLEQASSEATAKYKASLFQGKSFTDLTGGSGIDSWAMLENFKTATIIDIDENASERITHNMLILSEKPTKTINTSAENFISNMAEYDLALIDPQRRNTKRKGLYKLEDCTPNIIEILPQIRTKTILLKTSPMLDIDKGIEQLGCVSSVHVVEYNGECKELIFILKPNETTKNIPITAVSLNDKGTPTHTHTHTHETEANTPQNISTPLKYLYEPSPAFMKAGAYKSISDRFRAPKIHPHTHLYTAETSIKNFPGRAFKIINQFPARAKSIPFKQANLTVRNFPQDTATLKKKLKIKDGGDDYLFACTITDPKSQKNRHIILHCRKEKEIN